MEKTVFTDWQNSTSGSRKTIYIIRHGQTDYNKAGIVQGSGVDTDLNETGLKQARNFFNHYKTVPFTKIYTSSLKRTQQTVAGFIDAGIPFEILPELNEINWGIMEGAVPTDETRQMFLDTVNAWRNGLLDITVEGGETPQQLIGRQEQGLRKIMENDDSPLLICMHGRALRSFLCLLTGTPLHRMDDFEHGNVCLYVLEQKPDSHLFDITLRNCRAHLHDIIL